MKPDRAIFMAMTIIALGALTTCSEEVNRLRLRLGGVDGQPQGFTCLADPAPGSGQTAFLFQRGAGKQACMVLDLLRLGGVPGCRTSEILAWCEDESKCLPFGGDSRVTIPLDLSPFATIDVLNIQSVLESLAAQIPFGETVIADAPQEPVMIRAVVIAKSCDDVPASGEIFDRTAGECNLLMGCIYSCPVSLGDADGDIVLDLDVVGNRCQDVVEVCSSSTGFTEDKTCN